MTYVFVNQYLKQSKKEGRCVKLLKKEPQKLRLEQWALQDIVFKGAARVAVGN